MNLRIVPKPASASSVVRLGVDVAAGGTKELGVLTAVNGSTLTGFVRLGRQGGVEKADRPDEPVVQVLRQTPGTKLLVPSGDLRFGPNGRYVAHGLPAGHYVLVASATGYLPDRVEAEVGSNGDIEIPPLELDKACRLRVKVDPALDPRGGAWHVLLLDGRPGRGPQPAHAAPVDASGQWSFESAALGRPYRLKLTTSWDEPWWLDKEEFKPAAPEALREIRLGLVHVTGSARIGRLPLGGRLVFKDFGVEVTVPMRPEGRFDSMLPRAGSWNLVVSSEAPPVRRSTKLQVPAGGGEVLLEFPQTTLEGEVVDDTGQKIRGAELVITRVGQVERISQTLEDGVIFMAGLEPGQYRAYAWTENRESEIYNVTVEENGVTEPSPLRIVAKVKREVRGQLMTEAGVPVAGARVELVWAVGDLHPRNMQYRRSGTDGRFTIAVRDDQSNPCLLILPQGLPGRFVQVSVTREEQQIAIPQVGGTLDLSFAKPGSSAATAQSGKTLLRGNCIAVVGEFMYFGATTLSVEGRDVLRTPLLESGTYALCGLKPWQTGSYDGKSMPSQNCHTGTLVGGARLTLLVD